MSTKRRPQTPYVGRSPVSQRGRNGSSSRRVHAPREATHGGAGRTNLNLVGIPSLPAGLAARMGEDCNLTDEEIAESDRTIKEAMAAMQRKRWDELTGGVSVQQDDSEDDEDFRAFGFED